MKRQAVGHSKMKKLCRRMGWETWMGVGLMESLWHLAARETPLGDIGRLSNEDIAIAIDYTRDADELIEALLYAGWLDESEKHRLIIHDWHEHADDTTKKGVERKHLVFASQLLENPDKSVDVPTNPDKSAYQSQSQSQSQSQKPVVVVPQEKTGKPAAQARQPNGSNGNSHVHELEERLDSVRQLLYDFWGTIPDDAIVLRVEGGLKQATLEELRDFLLGLQRKHFEHKPWPYLARAIENQFNSPGRKRVVTNEAKALTDTG